MKYRRLLSATSEGAKVEDKMETGKEEVTPVINKVSPEETKKDVVVEVPKEVKKEEVPNMSAFEKKLSERLDALEKENYELKRSQIMQGIDANILKLAKEKGVDLSSLDNKALGTMAQLLGLAPTPTAKKVTHYQAVDTGIKDSDDFMTSWEKSRGRSK